MALHLGVKGGSIIRAATIDLRVESGSIIRAVTVELWLARLFPSAGRYQGSKFVLFW